MKEGAIRHLQEEVRFQALETDRKPEPLKLKAEPFWHERVIFEAKKMITQRIKP